VGQQRAKGPLISERRKVETGRTSARRRALIETGMRYDIPLVTIGLASEAALHGRRPTDESGFSSHFSLLTSPFSPYLAGA
jgi:hypothetical protein